MEVQQIRKQLEEMIRENQDRPVSMQQIRQKLQLNDPAQLQALEEAIRQLTEEYIAAISQKGNLISARMAGYEEGTITVNRKGFGFLDLESGESVHLSEANLHGAMNGDWVVVRRRPSSYGNQEGEVVRIREHRTTHVIGTFVTSAGKSLVLKLDDERIHTAVRVLNQREYKLVSGMKAQLQIVRYADPLQLKIVRLLGHADDPGVDVLSILLEYDIDPQFPDEVMEQAQKMPTRVCARDKAGRRDLTAETIITIDGEDSKDLDDAVSVEKTAEGYRLGVHIADVSYYVREGSPLDREALKRGTSTYVVDRVVPMLPHLLSNGICSLNPKVIRLTLSCVMELDEQGRVREAELFPSFIRTTERMTYTAVNAILDGDETVRRRYRKIVPMIELMAQCAQGIRRRRHDQGAINFEKEEARILLDEHGRIRDIQPRERLEAERMIEDFMVCANEAVARHMKQLEFPCLYRIHEAPEAEKLRSFAGIVRLLGKQLKGSVDHIQPRQLQQLLESFEGEDEYPVVSMLMLRSMQKAKYDPHCLGHFGLALREYTHFTSPIRRYPDLIVHRMIRRYCFEGQSDLQQIQRDELQMESIALQTSQRERIAIEAEREVEDMKKAEFMEDHVGMVAEGVISGVTKFGLFVELDNTVEGLIHVQKLTDDYYHYDPETMKLTGERTKKSYRLGQRVKIKVTASSKLHQEIDFDLVSPRRPSSLAQVRKESSGKSTGRRRESRPIRQRRGSRNPRGTRTGGKS